MQVVGAVVGFQLVGLAAHAEGGILDAVGIAAHERAAAGTAGRFKVLDVIGVGVVAQHHIHRSALGGHPDILDDTAVVQHTDRQPAGVRDDVFIDLFAVGVMPKGLERNCAIGSPPFVFFGDSTLSVLSFIVLIISQFSPSVLAFFKGIYPIFREIFCKFCPIGRKKAPEGQG